MDHLKNAMNLRENTLAWKFLLSMEAVNRLYLLLKRNATNSIIHDYHSTKGSRVKSLDKLRSTEM